MRLALCVGSRVRTAFTRQFEHRHRLHQLLGLALQAGGRRGHLLDQRRILLRDLVHIGDGLTHLRYSLAVDFHPKVTH